MGRRRDNEARMRVSLAELTASEPPSIDEVNVRHAGEWVLLLVTDLDDCQDVARGHVLDHGSSRARISQAVKRVRGSLPSAQLYTFVAGPQVRTGEEARKLLARAAAEWNGPHAGR